MDSVQDGVVWIIDVLSENPTGSWLILAAGCIALVWLVGRSARTSRF
jgi:hypothetical protein